MFAQLHLLTHTSPHRMQRGILRSYYSLPNYRGIVHHGVGPLQRGDVLALLLAQLLEGWTLMVLCSFGKKAISPYSFRLVSRINESHEMVMPSLSLRGVQLPHPQPLVGGVVVHTHLILINYYHVYCG